jgi:hypothetical protein
MSIDLVDLFKRKIPSRPSRVISGDFTDAMARQIKALYVAAANSRDADLLAYFDENMASSVSAFLEANQINPARLKIIMGQAALALAATDVTMSGYTKEDFEFIFDKSSIFNNNSMQLYQNIWLGSAADKVMPHFFDNTVLSDELRLGLLIANSMEALEIKNLPSRFTSSPILASLIDFNAGIGTSWKTSNTIRWAQGAINEDHDAIAAAYQKYFVDYGPTVVAPYLLSCETDRVFDNFAVAAELIKSASSISDIVEFTEHEYGLALGFTSDPSKAAIHEDRLIHLHSEVQLTKVLLRRLDWICANLAKDVDSGVMLDGDALDALSVVSGVFSRGLHLNNHTPSYCIRSCADNMSLPGVEALTGVALMSLRKIGFSAWNATECADIFRKLPLRAVVNLFRNESVAPEIRGNMLSARITGTGDTDFCQRPFLTETMVDLLLDESGPYFTNPAIAAFKQKHIAALQSAVCDAEFIDYELERQRSARMQGSIDRALEKPVTTHDMSFIKNSIRL